MADKSLYLSCVATPTVSLSSGGQTRPSAHTEIIGTTVGFAWDDARPACGLPVPSASLPDKKSYQGERCDDRIFTP
jgi:hypothetical protein